MFEDTIKAIQELEKTANLPFKRQRIIALKNSIIHRMIEEQLIEIKLNDCVLIYHPKTKYKNYPKGMLQIIPNEGYERMKNWKSQKVISTEALKEQDALL